MTCEQYKNLTCGEPPRHILISKAHKSRIDALMYFECATDVTKVKRNFEIRLICMEDRGLVL